VLGFSLTLLMDMHSKDEMAFVIGHEASHHILGHLNRQRKSAKGGAVIFGIFAAALGGSIESVDAAVDMGAAVGARNYSKDYEL
jgi:predicted Zn-dependent protease